MKKIIFLLFIFPILTFGQITFTWNEYFSYNNVVDICENDYQILAASENGIFFIENNEVVDKFSKVNFLNDVDISAIAFYDNKIFCGYKNGNLDIISSKVKNLPYIKDKNLSIDKNIFQFYPYQQSVFVATGFGIVKINLENEELEETYILDENSFNKVYSILIDKNTIYAATEKGLFYADVNSNLIDFKNWSYFPEFQNIEVKKIIKFTDKIFILTNDNQVKYFSNQTWQDFLTDTNIIDLAANDDFLAIAMQDKIYIYNSNLLKINQINSIDGQNLNLNKIYFSKSGKLIGGDKNLGLINFDDNLYFFPNAPLSNSIFSFCYLQNTLYCINGGYFQDYSPKNQKGQIYILKNNQWQNFQINDFQNFTSIAVDPQDLGHFFISTWDEGLLEFQNFEFLKKYTPENSSLEYSSDNLVQVSKVKFDKNNILWVAQRATNPVHTFFDNQWHKIALARTYTSSYTPTDINFFDDGRTIITIDFAGFATIFDNHTPFDFDDDISFCFTQKDENSELIGTHLNTSAIDKEDLVWFGGTDGIGIISNLDVVNNEADISRVIIKTQEKDTAIINYLLKGSYITKILVDPSNRKWIGTSNGLYLVSEYGNEQIFHFTAENSPLPSNFIQDLALNTENGELYIATNKGLVSFFTDAANGKSSFENALVYPNPVREDYEGIITIKNLKPETYVKITDLNGNLIYETISNGSIATWNGKNMFGQRPQTGVYLIFLTTADKSETKILKLLFIH